MQEEKTYWYVLFCHTGTEEKLADKLKDKLGNDSFPFVLQKSCIFRRQGEKSIFRKKLFPGYLFVESCNPANEFMGRAFPVVYKQKEAYRFLCYGDKSDIAMHEEERIALRKLLCEEHEIGISRGFIDGESIRITSGPLIGSESMILKINKNRNEAVIAVQMFNNVIPVSVGVDVIEKVNDA